MSRSEINYTANNLLTNFEGTLLYRATSALLRQRGGLAALDLVTFSHSIRSIAFY
jgi:hypothetical protein